MSSRSLIYDFLDIDSLCRKISDNNKTRRVTFYNNQPYDSIIIDIPIDDNNI